MNIEAIKSSFTNLANKTIGEPISQILIDRIGRDAAQIMYKYGFSEDLWKYKPVLSGINLRVQYDTPHLTLSFKPEPQKDWVTVSTMVEHQQDKAKISDDGTTYE
jgi:hypothetical protein